MLKEVKCLACGQMLFRIGPLDEKGEFWGLFKDDQERFERTHKRQGDREWCQCPACQRKNWLAGFSEPGKSLKTWISYVSE